MQANSIWAGNDYAYLPNAGRNTRFSLACYRVRVLRQRKELSFEGAKRSTTWVDVNFIDRDTGEVIDFAVPWHQQDVIKKNEDGSIAVRAYDFVEFWEQVEDRYKYEAKKKQEQEQERERLEAERRMEFERREAARLARLGGITDFLISLGIEKEWITRVDLHYGITLDVRKIEEAIAQEKVTHESSTF